MCGWQHANVCPVAVPAPAVTEAPPGIWGVVRTGPPSPGLHDTHIRGLATALGGLVAVGSEFPDASTLAVTLQAHASEAECLAAAIRRLPSSASMLAWFDGIVPPDTWPAAVTELASELGERDAAVFAAPVTDAVKQVRGGRIRRGVPRDGLCVPVPPLLVRASAARRNLLEHLERGADPISALGVSGLTVQVVPLRAPIKL